jgi:hypothetical protein
MAGLITEPAFDAITSLMTMAMLKMLVHMVDNVGF